MPKRNLSTIRPRGRPKMDPGVKREKTDRQVRFGINLKELRVAQGLTLDTAATAAGLESPRKLSQYETKCYPPGWVLRNLASVYQVTPKYLSSLKLASSDPDDWVSISDGLSPENFCAKTMITTNTGIE